MGGIRACRDLVHIFTREGGEMIAPSTGGKKASVDKGMQTAMVGPKLVEEVILSFHPWLLDGPIFRGTYVFDKVATK